MNGKLKHFSNQSCNRPEDDKYLKIFNHLESVNSRNKQAFDELLTFTYNNLEHDDNHNEEQHP